MMMLTRLATLLIVLAVLQVKLMRFAIGTNLEDNNNNSCQISGVYIMSFGS